jgi:hypothetical protein
MHWVFYPRLIESDGTASHLPPSVVVTNTAISGFRLNDPFTRVISYLFTSTLYMCLTWSVVWKHVDRWWGEIHMYIICYLNSEWLSLWSQGV